MIGLGKMGRLLDVHFSLPRSLVPLPIALPQ